ncbi:MAG: undecaprenyl-diphosphatase UppP [Myxococcales bacterium]|nr:undecaprenyl-diphosphatase UppP [Myxococcales bacterium]
MDPIQAVAYGLVQGLGEFLPISSSAHLALLPWAAGWTDPGLAFDVALHLGTLLSLVIYFRADLLRLARAFVGSVIERRIGADPDRRLAWLVLAGSIPAGAIGFLFEHAVEAWFRDPASIAATLIAFGAVLQLADAGSPGDRVIGRLTIRDALLIGLAQACAIVPGVSRSGSTITAGRLLGLDREAAARFSFLLSAPIVAGAGLLKVPKLIQSGGLDGRVALGILVSAVTGYFAIDVLLRLIRTRSYLPFAIYRLVFGSAVLALVWVRR